MFLLVYERTGGKITKIMPGASRSHSKDNLREQYTININIKDDAWVESQLFSEPFL